MSAHKPATPLPWIESPENYRDVTTPGWPDHGQHIARAYCAEDQQYIAHAANA